jgi:hypothetical protein
MGRLKVKFKVKRRAGNSGEREEEREGGREEERKRGWMQSESESEYTRGRRNLRVWVSNVM